MRIAFTMKLLPGNQASYRNRHDSLWPELKSLLEGAGIRYYSIFLDPETDQLFATCEAEDGTVLDRLSGYPVMQKWWAHMKDLMETNPDHSPVTRRLTEVFYLD
jgi:L-rhamnose mutarotase